MAKQQPSKKPTSMEPFKVLTIPEVDRRLRAAVTLRKTKRLYGDVLAAYDADLEIENLIELRCELMAESGKKEAA